MKEKFLVRYVLKVGLIMRYGIYVDTKNGKIYLAEEDGYLVRLENGCAAPEDILQETALLLLEGIVMEG